MVMVVFLGFFGGQRVSVLEKGSTLGSLHGKGGTLRLLKYTRWWLLGTGTCLETGQAERTELGCPLSPLYLVGKGFFTSEKVKTRNRFWSWKSTSPGVQK